MLGLQVDAPLHGEVELPAALLQNLHGLGVAHPAKLIGHHVVQPIQQPLVHKAVEKLHLLGAALQHPVDDILHHGLGHVHIILQVAEGHLRLDHPELGGVALGIGDLRSEGGAEGVHIPEGHGKVLRVQLAGNGQVRGFAEKVLGEVHLAVLGAGRVAGIQGGHPEHLAGALGVRAGDDGGVDIDKAPALEELMHGLCCHAAHPEGG